MSRLTRPWLILTALMFFGITGVACEVVVGYRMVDPEVDLETLDSGLDITGEPGVDVGFYHEQLYDPLHDGDDCPVVHGLQGGTWIMPALRIEGIFPFATTACTLTMETGEVVGQVSATTRFFLATDDKYEVQAFPVPVIHASPNEAEEIDDLFGLNATLDCTVIDSEERSGTVTRELVLVEG
ncbi:MAG: hypothetical protein QF464_06630 [Myxococcota bacterium]|jgi:hypothetical protein|nr:hypothetical protein [Myxococcota bacterium]